MNNKYDQCNPTSEDEVYFCIHLWEPFCSGTCFYAREVLDNLNIEYDNNGSRPKDPSKSLWDVINDLNQMGNDMDGEGI